jgi:CBS domain-containing protein
MKLDAPIEVILREKGSVVYTVPTDATVYEALLLMAEKQIGALVVMEGTTLAGIFSERDYARRVILAGRSSKEMRVHEIMTRPVLTVEPHTTIDECMKHMTNKRCRHLPVLDGGKLVAMISLGDLVNWIITTQERTIRALEDYISGDYPG